MKRILLLTAGILLALTFTACKHQASAPPSWVIATAPAATQNAQRIAGDSISAANAAVIKFETDKAANVAGTTDATLISIMSNLQKSLTVAQPLYNAWVAALKGDPTTVEPAALVNAVATMQTSYQSVPAAYKGGK